MAGFIPSPVRMVLSILLHRKKPPAPYAARRRRGCAVPHPHRRRAPQSEPRTTGPSPFYCPAVAALPLCLQLSPSPRPRPRRELPASAAEPLAFPPAGSSASSSLVGHLYFQAAAVLGLSASVPPPSSSLFLQRVAAVLRPASEGQVGNSVPHGGDEAGKVRFFYSPSMEWL
jgi:hypothetical protein